MTEAEQRWFDSWRGSHYDPRTRQIVIVGHPPAYVLSHELAHADQHRTGTLLFRLWSATLTWPLLNWLPRLLLERDADRRAVRDLQNKGVAGEPLNILARRLIGHA